MNKESIRDEFYRSINTLFELNGTQKEILRIAKEQMIYGYSSLTHPVKDMIASGRQHGKNYGPYYIIDDVYGYPYTDKNHMDVVNMSIEQLRTIRAKEFMYGIL